MKLVNNGISVKGFEADDDSEDSEDVEGVSNGQTEDTVYTSTYSDVMVYRSQFETKAFNKLASLASLERNLIFSTPVDPEKQLQVESSAFGCITMYFQSMVALHSNRY